MTKSKNINRPRWVWTPEQLAFLTKHYSDTKTSEVAQQLGCDITRVYAKANQMGLKKGATFFASSASGRMLKGGSLSVNTQFKPGHTSWNTGLKGVTGTQEACRATQFKKGRPAQESRNYKPIGSLRVSADGYLERKITDDKSLYPARRWIGVHRLVWEAANGTTPKGYLIVFKPGRKTTDIERITLDALELISRVENMRRNTVHSKYPKEVARLVQLRGALTRSINRKAKEGTKS